MKTAVMIGVVVGAVGIAAAGGGAAYFMKASAPSAEELRVAQEAAAHERFVREEEINYATLFSYVRAGGSSQPVMVTLHLAGTIGLETFCRQQPVVEEAVLRSLAAEGARARLADAINGVLDGRPVRNATARAIGNQSAAAAAGRDTETKCRKLLKG